MKKVAIVTGASRGIGAATAKLLAQRGYAVCVNYLSTKERADKLVHEIVSHGGEAIAIKANMAIESDILAMFNEVDETLGPVSALVNNAGTNGGISEVQDIRLSTLESVFATNVFGTFITCREAIKRMKQNGGGGIVNVSSEAAKFGGTKMAHYSSSKAAINTFTIALAREVAPLNIRVNTVSPGVIGTEIHNQSPPDRIEALVKSLPMGRMGESNEVAETIAWLLSDSASYVSGSIISVTGAR
jgi:NAD(P)-dependent dehydrogenase (short-subunit alcohol dehydrogenase family)